MKAKALILALTILFVPLATLAHGQTEGSTTPEERKQAAQAFREQLIAEKKQELTDARAARIVERCERLQAKVEQVSARLVIVRTARGNLVSNLVERLETFSPRLAAAGADTTELDADIATLKTMSDELNQLWQTYIDKVTALGDASCEDGANPFHEALETAKAAMADVKTKFKEIKDFLNSDIKPDLQHIRLELAGESADDTNDTENNGEQAEE